ncbi:TPA: glycosyltransferase family 2 protein, partial [Escherichia coli]
MLSYCFLIISLGFWDKQVNKLISVIIPVFNVEKYIRDCIDSLTIQVVAGFSFEESVEVIFIDDGSPDNS